MLPNVKVLNPGWRYFMSHSRELGTKSKEPIVCGRSGKESRYRGREKERTEKSQVYVTFYSSLHKTSIV